MPIHRSSKPAGRIAQGVRGLGALLLIVGVLALVPARSAGADGLTIAITSGLEPRNATVAPGTTITWVNNDGERHRIRSTAGASFDSGNLEPGERFSFTFSAEGRSAYLDERDRDAAAYHGSVAVSGSTSAPPPADPAPGGGATPAPTPAPPQSAEVTIAIGSSRRRR